MTERIQEFLRNRRSEGQDTEPCLVVDLEVVRDNYQTFAKALPDSRVFYAVKANPAPEVLSLLASMSRKCWKRLGLEPCGISFHVGSQQRKVKAWDRALAMASTVFRDCAERGINLSMRQCVAVCIACERGVTTTCSTSCTLKGAR